MQARHKTSLCRDSSVMLRKLFSSFTVRRCSKIEQWGRIIVIGNPLKVPGKSILTPPPGPLSFSFKEKERRGEDAFSLQLLASVLQAVHTPRARVVESIR